MGYRGKRALDLTITIPALILFMPLMLVIAAIVRWNLGSPALFRQLRPGLHGRPFTIYKFRTMLDPRDGDGRQSDEERLTRFGAFLRSTSMDELPELFNVLKGEMSIVGPRPLLMAYLERYSPEQRRRHEARPGITGWAQVNGRNALNWDQRFLQDIWYVDHQSLLLDLKIIAVTVWTVLRRDGISEADHATMTEFRGNPPERSVGS